VVKNFGDKDCRRCNKTFTKKSPRVDFCIECRPFYRKEYLKDSKREYYLRTRVLKDGPRSYPKEPINCKECNKSFLRNNNTQKVCLDCRESSRRKYCSNYVKTRYQKDLDYRKKCRTSNNKAKRKWVSNNPERHRNMTRLYTMKRRSIGIISLDSIQLVYEDNIKKYGTLTCILCIKPIGFGKDSLEHKLPICRGGTNDYENLGVSHFKCNVSKGRKTVEEYKKFVEASIG